MVKSDQSGASADGDLSAGDINKHTNHFYLHPQTPAGTEYSALSKWTKQLEAAQKKGDTIVYDVSNLAFYKRKRKSADGIDGLEAKLTMGGRTQHIEDARDQKMSFEMILDEWSLFASAQEIFAQLLAIIHRRFNLLKDSISDDVPNAMWDQMVDSQILEPIVNECGQVHQFEVNLNVALGMLYWLADQCVIRWHK